MSDEAMERSLEGDVSNEDRLRASLDLAHADLRDLLDVLGLGTHARTVTPHVVMQEEVLPAIRLLVHQRDAAEEERNYTTQLFRTASRVSAALANPEMLEFLETGLLPFLRQLQAEREAGLRD